jgi:DNA (cytosine-5)-methyltransferase 1
MLKAIDFFCGGGGMSYGLKQAGINVIAGLDIDYKCKATYEINNPGSIFIARDIIDMSEKELIDYVPIKRNDKKMIFVGCSPCQFWTIINTNKTKSEKSKSLLFEFMRFIDFYNPGFVLIENVPGLFKRQKESKLDEFISFLKSKKYSIAHNVVNMNDYGVPQHRKRYSLIASRITDKIELPEPDKQNRLTVKDVLGEINGFPKIPAGSIDNSDFFHSTCRLAQINIERIRRTPKNGGTRISYSTDDNLAINAHKKTKKSFSDVYGRMSWDKPAPTITTRFCSFSNGRFGHPEEDRALSIREGATLQTFPKDYIFKVNSIGQAAKIIGNAVPPEYARRIGEQIINKFFED